MNGGPSGGPDPVRCAQRRSPRLHLTVQIGARLGFISEIERPAGAGLVAVVNGQGESFRA